MSDDEIITEAKAIAAALGMHAPEHATSPDDWRAWVAWWKPSYESARQLSEEQRRYLKAGGWWPPATASQIENPAPEIVVQTRRPGLFRCA